MFFRLPIFYLALLLAAAAPAPAQVPPDTLLPRLLAGRREQLRQYEAAQAQRHALFGLTGQPSRQDLQRVVTALQGLVEQDGRIVAVLDQRGRQAQVAASTLQATGRTDRNVTASRVAELRNDLQNAQERLRQAAQRQQALAADLAEAQRGRRWRDALIAGLALLGGALLLWRRR